MAYRIPTQRLIKSPDKAAQDKSLLFIESGADLSYGSSVHLDALRWRVFSVPSYLIVAAGEPDSLIDDLTFLKRSVDLTGIDFRRFISQQKFAIRRTFPCLSIAHFRSRLDRPRMVPTPLRALLSISWLSR